MGDIEKMIQNSLEIAPMRHRSIIADSTLMKDYDMTDDMAYSILGMGYGRGILKPRQLLRAREAWQKPPQKEFSDRNLWSVYNAITEALKTTAPRDVLESHSRAHALVMKQGIQVAEGFEPRMVA